MLYEFNFKIDDKIYYDFNIFTALHGPNSKKTVRNYRFCGPILFMCMAFIYLTASNNLFSTCLAFALYSIASILWIIFTKPMIRRNIKGQIKKLKKVGKLPYTENTTMQFFDDYFLDFDADSKQEFSYNKIEKISVNDNGDVYLYTSVVQACIIIASAFESQEQKQEFLKFITEKTNTVTV